MSVTGENDLDNVLGRVSACRSSVELISELRHHTSAMGFEHFSYYIVQPPSMPHATYVASSYPEAWKDYYKAEDYINVDPIVRATASRVTPFLWRPLIDARYLTAQQVNFCNQAGEAGVITGGSIPLRGPGACIATFSVSAQVPEADFSQLWNKHRHTLHVLSAYAHEMLVPLIFSEKKEELFTLSPRERECLLWTARGKSAWSIGEILNISQSTVEEYLLGACRKLGVKNRIQAVVIAIMNGHIVP